MSGGWRVAVAAGALVVAGGLALAPAGAAEAPPAPVSCADPNRPPLIDADSRARQILGGEALSGRATGKGVTVAVVDSGVDVRNVHLRGKAVLPGKSFIPADTSKGRIDAHGHGTAIAGIIAARPVKDSGVVGLAPAARILPVRVFVGPVGGAVTPANGPRVDRIAAGIDWAAANGADVINVSMSAPSPDAALVAAVEKAQKKGALVVASVGNSTDQGLRTDGTEARAIADGKRYPAALPGVLGVTAAVLGDGVADDAVAGPHVDVAAPGSNVLTAYYDRGDCVLAADKTSTSFATGYASAAAAVLVEAYPKNGPERIAYRLMSTAADALAGSRTDEAGWGLIKPLAALDATVPSGVLPPIGRAAATSTGTGPQAPSDRALLTATAAVDPTEDAREASVWWVAAGVTGLALALLFGMLAGGRLRSGGS